MAPIVGRDDERGTVEALASPGAGGVLVVVGEPGLGKTTLLTHAAQNARSAGRPVLLACGTVAERELPFAALHQLLHGRLDQVRRLPGPQRRALGAALGLVDEQAMPDRLHLAAATLTLLTDPPATDGPASAAGPGGADEDATGALVVVDDLQWFDDASRDVVLFCARRLQDGDGHTALLVATRPPGAPVGLPTVDLAPLPDADAHRLLDLLPDPPTASRRDAVVRLATGNPLALVELSRHGTGDDGDTAAAPSPAAGRVEASFAGRLRPLPPRTRRLLLLSAAADTDDLTTVIAADRGDLGVRGAPDAAEIDSSLAAWTPAEEAGLVRLDGRHVRFRHPLARSAVYRAAPLAERRGAHLALAGAAADPDRRAWHLAAAAIGPDAAVASTLEATAGRARERGGWAAAARALERAADLSPDPEESARRLLLAAPAAMFTGRTAWVERLAAQARSRTRSTETQVEAELYAGWAISSTTRHAEAVARLTGVARRTADRDPDLAVSALAPAAVTAYNAGDDALLDDVAAALAVVQAGRGAGPHEPEDPGTAWVLGATEPFSPASRAALDRSVRAHADLGIRELNMLGGAAWVLDETTLAERLLSRLVELFGDGPTEGTNALVTSTLAYTQLELGRWDDAQANAENAVRIADETGMPVVRSAALTTMAQIAAHRGRLDEARDLAGQALGSVDPETTRTIAVRARHALGLAALTAGEPEGAYDLLRRAFDDEGSPRQRHMSVYSLVLLAAAGVRGDREPDARRVVEATAAHVGPDPGPRVAAALHHARALLAGPDDAERHFRAALADPAGATWSFERALIRLDLGERLRRSKQVSAARTELSAALETFVRLGAVPFADRATAELRAAGVKVADRVSDRLAELTPQQRRIALLAARGRTNREIAEQLFLSPRTVGFHLYRVFPVLGVTSRAQLRDVVDAGADPS